MVTDVSDIHDWKAYWSDYDDDDDDDDDNDDNDDDDKTTIMIIIMNNNNNTNRCNTSRKRNGCHGATWIKSKLTFWE